MINLTLCLNHLNRELLESCKLLRSSRIETTMNTNGVVLVKVLWLDVDLVKDLLEIVCLNVFFVLASPFTNK